MCIDTKLFVSFFFFQLCSVGGVRDHHTHSHLSRVRLSPLCTAYVISKWQRLVFFRIEEVKTCTFLTSCESSLSKETTDTMFLLLKWALTNKHCVRQIQKVVVSAVVWSAGGVPVVSAGFHQTLIHVLICWDEMRLQPQMHLAS